MASPPLHRKARTVTAKKPKFEIVDAGPKPTRVARPRRDWAPIVAALAEGNILWMGDDELSDANLKYLAQVCFRRNRGEKLRYRRDERGGKLGRLMWLEQLELEPSPDKINPRWRRETEAPF